MIKYLMVIIAQFYTFIFIIQMENVDEHLKSLLLKYFEREQNHLNSSQKWLMNSLKRDSHFQIFGWEIRVMRSVLYQLYRHQNQKTGIETQSAHLCATYIVTIN